MRKLVATLGLCTVAAGICLTGAASAVADDGWVRYGVYSSDAECRSKATELRESGTIDGFECVPAGDDIALDVHYR
jgi:hypothetical protein